MSRGSLDTQKVTISLPYDLLRYADRRAGELGGSRSQFIGHALAELRTREAEALAREGYAFYAGEAEEFAEASLAANSGALSDDG